MKIIYTLFFIMPFMAFSQFGCGDTFTDSGGSGSAYSNDENQTYTVCPSLSTQHVVVSFSSFDLETNYDYLSVYDGNSTSGTLLGSFTGISIDAFFESTTADGCLTFVFTSDGSVTNAGWIASVTCVNDGGGGGSNNLSVDKAHSADILNNFEYTLIPNSQRTAMTFGALISNLTGTSHPVKTMTVVVNDGTSNVYTGTQDFSIGGFETSYQFITTTFTPAANKTFTVTVSVDDDTDNSNNSKTTTFQTQADYYGHDFNSTTTHGASSAGGNYFFVNRFFSNGTGTVYSIDVKLAAGTTPNQTLRAFLESDNGFMSDGTKLITASDINNGGFTRIYLDPPVQLTNTGQGFNYYAGVGSDNLSLTLNTFTNENSNEDNASGIVLNGAYSNFGSTLAVRMNFNQGCASFNATATPVASQSCIANSGEINLLMTTGGTSVANQNNISWTGTSSGSLSNQNNICAINGLAPGSYVVTITNNGCSMTIPNVSIGSVQAPTISISQTSDITCFGEADGALSYTTSGSTSGYNFSWNTGATATSISGLESGVYTVSGSNGVCTISQSFTLQDPAQLSINATKTNVTTCGGTNGAIQLNVTGGTETNYFYTWTGPVTGSSGAGFGNPFSINNLSAGNYIIMVSNGSCTNSTTVSISETGAPTLSITVLNGITCPGLSNGDLKVTSTTNITPYTFTWSTGTTGINLNDVAAGTYSVVGTNGTCTIAASFVLADPNPIEISGVSGVSFIATTITGGTGNLTYSWSGPGGFSANTPSVNNLTALGNYTITVTDQNGCTASKSFTLAFLSAEEIAKGIDFKYYPNPSSTLINFELNQDVSEIQIFDFSGKLIQSLNVNQELIQLNLDSYSNGVYLFDVISKENKVIYRNKFTVIK